MLKYNNDFLTITNTSHKALWSRIRQSLCYWNQSAYIHIDMYIIDITETVQSDKTNYRIVCPFMTNLYFSTADGSVLFRNSKRLIPMPASLPGIRVSMPSDHVLVNLDGVGITLKWDTNVRLFYTFCYVY